MEAPTFIEFPTGITMITVAVDQIATIKSTGIGTQIVLKTINDGKNTYFSTSMPYEEVLEKVNRLSKHTR